MTEKTQAPQPAHAAPEIDYTALIHAGFERHKYRQGTNNCVAFKHGAEWFREQVAAQAPAVKDNDEQDAARYRHWRDHAEVLCAVLRYESPSWIDAYLAQALAERDASKPPVQPMGGA